MCKFEAVMEIRFILRSLGEYTHEDAIVRGERTVVAARLRWIVHTAREESTGR